VLLRDFQKNDDKNFGGETNRIVKHDRMDAHGKEVSGCFVWTDVVTAVLPGEVIAVNKDMAPSLGYVDDRHGRLVPVVHPSELNYAFTKYLQMESGHVVSSNAPVPCVQGGVGGVAGAVQAAGSGSSFVMPKDGFVVPSKNFSVYGKKLKHIHLGGFSVETDHLSDRVIRFRKSDNKVVMPEMLVVLGRYDSYKNANRAVLKLISSKDDKVADLTSLEIDTTLFDTVSASLFIRKFKFSVPISSQN